MMLTFPRVVTVLLDKQEIGPLIIDKISLDVFRTLHHMFQVLVNWVSLLEIAFEI